MTIVSESRSTRFAVRRVVTGPWRENCYVLSDDAGEAVVIDPGDDGDDITSLIEDAGLKPCAIIATHGHHDHVGAAATLKQRYDIPFYLHSADQKILKRANFYRRLFDKADAVELPAVDRALEPGAELDFGAMRIRVLHTPGHTPGGVSFALEEQLFSGDILLKGKVGRVDLPGGDRETLAVSLRMLAELPSETELFPGHGEPTGLSVELASNEELRELLT